MTQRSTITRPLTIPEGAGVAYLSGRHCGIVGLVAPDYFELIREDGPALWLTPEAVCTADEFRVVLICEERELMELRAR